MRLTNDQIFERAFLVRLIWEISKNAIPHEGRHITETFRQEYRDIMSLCYNKTQTWEVEGDICRVSNGFFTMMAGAGGALLTTKTSMVVFGLCILAAEKYEGLFTDRFEANLNAFNDELQKEATDEMAEVEKSAQKKLRQVVGYLHSRFKFKELEA